MPEPIVVSYTQPSPHLLSLLSSHVPQALPLLRRLQFTRFTGGITEHSRVLFFGASGIEEITRTDDDADGEDTTTTTAVFTAAYVDLSRCPETEVWAYSSLERVAAPASAEQIQQAGSQALALLRTVRELRDAYDAAREDKREQPAVLFGTLSEVVRKLLLGRGAVFAYCSLWDKWVFRLDALPDAAVARVGEVMEEQGMSWGRIGREDTGLVISRSKISRKEKTLVLLPSMAIKLGDGTPIAWAFLGTDGSLMSLHCEEQHRGQGFAKAVASKLMRHHLKDFGSDGYCMADVAPDNAQSQAVCRSLGGKVMWTSSWSRIDLDRSAGTRRL
ncbi:hypothetical protein TruAng_011801 [Truncatella angustata]|nr:hypothetical protein TruAng_011801 [Truncatella angustata]